MNDGIKPELCLLSYVSVDNTVCMTMELGPGALMAKLDIQSAYRIIPVRPGDRKLLSMSCHLYVDKVLPLGLCLASIIYMYCSCRSSAVDTGDARDEICHALS